MNVAAQRKAIYLVYLTDSTGVSGESAGVVAAHSCLLNISERIFPILNAVF